MRVNALVYWLFLSNTSSSSSPGSVKVAGAGEVLVTCLFAHAITRLCRAAITIEKSKLMPIAWPGANGVSLFACDGTRMLVFGSVVPAQSQSVPFDNRGALGEAIKVTKPFGFTVAMRDGGMSFSRRYISSVAFHFGIKIIQDRNVHLLAGILKLFLLPLV